MKLFKLDRLFAEHCFFVFVCIALFIAPEVSVGWLFPEFMVSSTVSLGLIPLFLWLVFLIVNDGWRPTLLVRVSFPVLMLMVFSCYALINSLLQSGSIGQLMALQWLLYCWMSIYVFRSYLSRLREAVDIDLLINILIVIAVIIAVGGLISLFTGPIYTFQTVNNIGRIWCGLYLPQAVGFGVNANVAAGLFSFFILFVLLFSSASRVVLIVIFALMLTSLLATLSRIGVLSFFIALISAIVLLFYLYSSRGVYFSGLKDTMIGLGFGGVVTLIVVSSFFALYPPAYDSVRHGLGLSPTGICQSGVTQDQSGVTQDGRIMKRLVYSESVRLLLWRKAVARFLGSDFSHKVFGYGWGNEASYGTNYAGDKLLITVHSSYLAILLDNGMIGLFFFFAACAIALFQSFQRSRDGYREGAFVFSFLLAFAVFCITETFVFGVQYVVLLMFSLMLIDVHPFDLRHSGGVRDQKVDSDSLNQSVMGRT